MSDLRFVVNLDWKGAGRDGDGTCTFADGAVRYSAPAEMGGAGAGTNPEELLIAAVSSCYSITLSILLRAAKLPTDHVGVRGEGIVSDFPQAARFSRIVVHPTITGADLAREQDYVAAARQARDRCFIGRSVRDSLDYAVGSVVVRGGE